MDPVLGIDIGGSGIKANLVDVTLGEVVSDRLKIETPQPSTPDAVAKVVAEVAREFPGQGAIGCTFPAVMRNGVARTASNVDQSWIGTDAAGLFSKTTDRKVTVVNDADAAGVAEMTFGAGKGRSGVVICLTLGTGIGSALFTHGVLVPNTEFGQLSFAGYEIVEDWAAARAREDENLSWEEWGGRVNRFLNYLDGIFSPELFVLGGGVSRRFKKFSSFLDVDCDVVAALMHNEAGIVGAAMAAVSG